MHDADRAGDVLGGQRHNHQRSGLDFLLNGRLGQDADPRPDLHRLLDGLDVVELHDHLHVDLVLAEDLVQLPADDQLAVKADERLAAKVREADLPHVRQAVPGAADQHHGLVAQGDDGQAAMGGRVGQDAQVGFLFQHRLVDPSRMQVLQAHIGLRVAGHELLHALAQGVEPHRIDGRHPHGPGDLLAERANLRLHPREAIENLAQGFKAHLPLGGQQERPLGAIDQLHRQQALELVHRLAHRRLADPVHRRPAGE